MHLSELGPRLDTINAILGDYFHRDWIDQLYGVDLMFYSFLIACRILPNIPLILPSEQLMGIVLVPSKHKKVWMDQKIRESLQEMQKKNEIMIHISRDVSKEDPSPKDEPFGIITVKDLNPEEAKDTLLKLCDKFQISSEDYKVSEYVKYFDVE